MPLANAGAAYGWRARIGLLQPSMASDTNPFEFYLMAPEGVQLVLTSLGMADEGPREVEYAKAIEGIEVPIRRVLARKVDCIIQAGVPPIVNRGWGFEDELKARVATITDVPFASDIGCCIAAMQAVGIRKLALLVNQGLQQTLVDYLSHAGIEVSAAQAAPPTEHAGSESLVVQYRAAVQLFRSAPGADGIYIPIAARPSVGMLQALEQETGVPAISSAQAMMWQGLRLAGVNPSSVTGFGRLFQAA